MDRFFKITSRGSTVSREIMGGLTTFLAMSYILSVNPNVLSQTGMGWNAVFTATAVASGIATFVMALIANLPVALAPSLGLNAFFTYTVVLGMGCSWQLALTAVLAGGIAFIILSLFGVREAILKSIPDALKKSVAVGIGLFIALIGLSNAGIVTTDTGTVVSFVDFSMEHSTALVAVIGLVITIVLYILKVPGSMLLSIAATTIIGIAFGVTRVPEGWTPFSLPSAPLLFAFDFRGALFDSSGAFSLAVFGRFFMIFFTFLFTALFDTMGTLLGVAEQGNLKDKNGQVLNAKEALLSDAIGTVAGACLGTSTVTSFVESASGVAAGARTGLASVVTGTLFFAALFLTPLFALVPAAATAPALIFVGFLMMKSVVAINFVDPTEGIPAFITIITMPFAYSISKGIMWGIISYVICKVAGRKAKSISGVTWVLAVIFLLDIIFEAVR